MPDATAPADQRGCDHEPSEAANSNGETVCMDCGTTLGGDVTVTLRRDDMQRVYELAVARAVSIEGAEAEVRFPLGSEAFRRPANAIREVLDV